MKSFKEETGYVNRQVRENEVLKVCAPSPF